MSKGWAGLTHFFMPREYVLQCEFNSDGIDMMIYDLN